MADLRVETVMASNDRMDEIGYDAVLYAVFDGADNIHIALPSYEEAESYINGWPIQRYG